jgi:hypothetical protein
VGGVEVHHLTYAHIFNEPPEDLMVLCFYHHRAAEESIANGEIPRRGELAQIVDRTFEVLSTYGKKKWKLEISGKSFTTPYPNNQTQLSLLNQEWFCESLMMAKKSFKSEMHRRFNGEKWRDSLIANAFAVYARYASARKRERRVFSKLQRKRLKKENRIREILKESAMYKAMVPK